MNGGNTATCPTFSLGRGSVCHIGRLLYWRKKKELLEHLQQLLQIFVLFVEWTVTFNFYLPTFSNTLSNRFSIPFFISFKYYFFIHSLFFFYNHLLFLYLFPTIIFFNENCYIYNIFCNTFTRITSKSYVENC